MALCALHVNLLIRKVDLHGARVKRRRAWVCRSSLTIPVVAAAPTAAVTANLRNLVSRNEIQHIKLGRAVRFTQNQLNDFVSEKTAKAEKRKKKTEFTVN